MFLYLCALYGLIGFDDVVVEHVDQIECNTFLNEESGNLVFKQYIIWEWYEGRHIAREYRLDKDQALTYDNRTRTWSLMLDSSHELRTKHLKRTVTTYDPDVADRDKFPKERRKLLIRKVK